MKKKILGIAVIATVAVAVSWNISQSENEIKLSDLALDNIEALANIKYIEPVWDIYPTSTGHSCIRGGSHSCL